MAGVLSGGMCSLQNQDAQAVPARKAPHLVTQVVEPLSCHRDRGNPETVLARRRGVSSSGSQRESHHM